VSYVYKDWTKKKEECDICDLIKLICKCQEKDNKKWEDKKEDKKCPKCRYGNYQDAEKEDDGWDY
jgi:hypothetical protein